MTVGTFKDFIRGASVSRTITGDLTCDLKHDTTLPDTFADLHAMRSYLRFHNACSEALAAAPAVWRRYERWRMKKPPGR